MSDIRQYLHDLKSGRVQNDFTASVNKVRQSSEAMRREYQSIVDKYPDSAYKHCVWMLDQEAKLLYMLEETAKNTFSLAEIVIEMRLAQAKTQAKPAKKQRRTG